jgi:tetratricopeptide (TPR) repeat protein
MLKVDVDVHDVVAELGTYSLLAYDKDDSMFLYMHRLLQKTIQRKIGGNTWWLALCLDMVCGVFGCGLGDKSSRKVFGRNVLHVLEIANYAEEKFDRGDEVVQGKIGWLYNAAGCGFCDLGRYGEALEEYKKALDIRERVLGKDHPSTAATYNNIANVYNSQGLYGEALEEYKKALDIKERKLGKDHPDTAVTYNNIAKVYDSQGLYPEALEEYKKALDIKERKLGKDHPSTAVTYNNIANVYRSQGLYDAALAEHKKALDIYERVLGKDHPSTISAQKRINLLQNLNKRPK